MDYEKKIAKAGLKINAIKLNPNNPFTWASGFKMPIYNDNRMFLFYPSSRKLIAQGFENLLNIGEISCDIVAGTSTAGISPGTTLADLIDIPFVYVRDKPKNHGLKNQIEGIDAESDLQKKKVVLIEDLISTGGSSARAVQAIRDANGKCNYCFSIFNYGLDKAKKVFSGKEPYNKKGNKLKFECKVVSLLRYETLLEVAKQEKYLTNKQVKLLEEWRANPLEWGEKHGFPKVEKP